MTPIVPRALARLHEHAPRAAEAIGNALGYDLTWACPTHGPPEEPPCP